MIKQTRAALAGAAILLASFQASAIPLSTTYDFYKLTDTNVEDLGGQLSVTVWDWTLANSTFVGQAGYVALTSGQVLFTLQNNVGDASNIGEVYFDDGFFGTSTAYNSLGTDDFTNFVGGNISPTKPANLPGAELADPDFVATAGFSADTLPGGPDNGVNTNIDILGIMLNLGGFADYTAVVAAMDSGALRVGLHVRSIGVEGGSDSYVNNPPDGPIDPEPNPAPVPGTLLLLGAGLLGVARSRRKS
jgi:PEP-CTERM motif